MIFMTVLPPFLKHILGGPATKLCRGSHRSSGGPCNDFSMVIAKIIQNQFRRNDILQFYFQRVVYPPGLLGHQLIKGTNRFMIIFNTF